VKSGLIVLLGVLPVLGCSGRYVISPTGIIEIITYTSGSQLDLDGYGISIDQRAEVAMGLDAAFRHENVPSGSHHIRLAGMASNCALKGDNPRAVSVSAGGIATVEFRITCDPLADPRLLPSR
jgi:hypothetical protein